MKLCKPCLSEYNLTKIVLNEVKDNQVLLELCYRKNKQKQKNPKNWTNILANPVSAAIVIVILINLINICFIFP